MISNLQDKSNLLQLLIYNMKKNLKWYKIALKLKKKKMNLVQLFLMTIGETNLNNQILLELLIIKFLAKLLINKCILKINN